MNRRGFIGGCLLSAVSMGGDPAQAKLQADNSLKKVPDRIRESVEQVAKRMGWRLANPLYGGVGRQSGYYERQQAQWHVVCGMADSSDTFSLRADVRTGCVLHFSKYYLVEAERRRFAEGEKIRIERDKAVEITRDLTRKMDIPGEDWKVATTWLSVPDKAYRSFNHPYWHIRLHRSVHGYLSWSEDVNCSLSPLDGSVFSWSRRFPKEYVSPFKPTLSPKDAEHIAFSMAGREIRLGVTKLGEVETNGLLWVPLAPGIPYHRLTYMFYVPYREDSPEADKRFSALFLTVDATTAEVGSLQGQPMTKYSDGGWFTRATTSFHPRGALLSAIRTPEMSEGLESLGRAIASGKVARAAEPSERMLRFQEGGHDYSLDAKSRILQWRNRTTVWGKASEPSDHWLSLRLSEEQMMTLLHWLSAQGKSLSRGR